LNRIQSDGSLQRLKDRPPVLRVDVGNAISEKSAENSSSDSKAVLASHPGTPKTRALTSTSSTTAVAVPELSLEPIARNMFPDDYENLSMAESSPGTLSPDSVDVKLVHLPQSTNSNPMSEYIAPIYAKKTKEAFPPLLKGTFRA
jgi:hypothetical protein